MRNIGIVLRTRVEMNVEYVLPKLISVYRICIQHIKAQSSVKHVKLVDAFYK